MPRLISGNSSELKMRRLIDFHTVKDLNKSTDQNKNTHITHRTYLTDASFGALLHGDAVLLAEIAAALRQPRWGIWLGRKCCIPSAPVFAALSPEKEEALKPLLNGVPLEQFTHQVEAGSMDEGTDTLQDNVLTFLSERREFAPRRVRTIPGRKGEEP